PAERQQPCDKRYPRDREDLINSARRLGVDTGQDPRC
ncbi:unnamed protein product, partial [Allacma fusca]